MNSTKVSQWKIITIVISLVGIPVGLLLFSGCPSYPEVTSPESLQLTKKLYGACNTKNEKLLAETKADLTKLLAEQKVTKNEADAFQGIIALAEAHRWDKATQEAFQFAKDQVGR
ncbi:MAG: hypothetical protein R3B84_22365 [Zavarzinella sp.]